VSFTQAPEKKPVKENIFLGRHQPLPRLQEKLIEAKRPQI